MAIAISADQILIDIRTWYYRLRMVQAHLDRTAGELVLLPDAREYCLAVIADLLEACEDAETFISREAQDAEAQARLGTLRSDQPDRSREPGC